MIAISMAVLTLIIIAFTVYASIQGFRQPEIVDRYLFSTEQIFRGHEYHRLLTNALVHSDWMHLLFNMISLYSFGSAVERNLSWGGLLLAVIYLSSIAGGSLLALGLHRHHDYQALGAAGGVCGVIFACIFLFPETTISFFLIPMPASLFAILFLGVSIWGIRTQAGRIGHDTHLGGAVIGLLVTTALFPGIVLQSPLLYLAVLGISGALFLYLYKFPPLLRPLKARHTAPGRSLRVETPDPDQNTPEERQEERERHDKAIMNRLLDKISASGMESLTEFERKQLEHISRRLRGPKQ